MKIGIREIVFVVLLTAIPVAAWAFVFRPNNVCKAEMAAEIASRQAKLQALNKATATIGDLKSEIAALEKAINFFRSKLPSEKEMDKVLREVWLLAEANKRVLSKGLRSVRFAAGDALEILNTEGSFDLVFSSWVLGYIAALITVSVGKGLI